MPAETFQPKEHPNKAEIEKARESLVFFEELLKMAIQEDKNSDIIRRFELVINDIKEEISELKK